MSKKALKKFISEAPRPELEQQILDLYERFPDVKTYYTFIFNPREEQLIQEAKARVHKEYFPPKRRRPKARRSVAQRYIRHFKTLGVDPPWVADFMLFNLEIAQRFSEHRRVPQAFYKSMLKSFEEAVQFIVHHRLVPAHRERILAVYQTTREQKWPYGPAFSQVLDQIDI